jgi:sugar lactone lactonase YvrE
MSSINLFPGRLKFKTIISIGTSLFLLILIGMFGFLIEATAQDILTYESCINRTFDEPQCKDCCDCIADPEQRQACRDACAESDFSDNTDSGPVDPNNDGNISIDQAISDEAQMKTIAFSGLAFLTGNFCSSTFFPPGKVSDFFGFQYMRDITPNGFGHNTEFAGRISDSVLSILTDEQVQALVSMANTQADQVDAYGYKRFVLIKAFQRLLENDLPDGASGLDKNAVLEFTGDLYEIDAQISYTRASVIGGIVAGLSEAQKKEFTDLLDEFNTMFENAGEGGTIASDDWPAATVVDLSDLTAKDGRVLVSTYATQLFSWYLGSVEGDTYFCPERHGTYFGSFYFKDIPPLTAQEGVTITEGMTAETGEAFLDELNTTQQNLVTSLLDIQQTNLNNIVIKRQAISEKLRDFMIGSPVGQSEVDELIRQYGEYEGEMMYYYATHFAEIGNTMTDTQADALIGLRLDYYSSFPDYQNNSNAYDCSGAWLYASKIDMPDIINTDFLFGVGEESDADIKSVIKEEAQIILLTNGFSFAEGPAANKEGDLYFSDILANKIYKWSLSGNLSEFRTTSGGANGLFFDSSNNLIICESNNQRLVSIDISGNLSVLTDAFNNIPFNEPNDLWIDPKGGIYFSDPVYNASLVQDGEHVYYLTPKRDNLIRVINDMIRPNGIIGTQDATTLYVTDHGAGDTYQYDIDPDGSLSNKQVFAQKGADGMTIDSEGNVYLCEENILVYDSSGNHIETINMPEEPTNVCFGGSDRHTLFITTRSALYSLQMRVSGISNTENGSDLLTPLTQTQVSRLYVSVFGRASEGSGNAYWCSRQDNMVGTANTMLATDSAKAYFGTRLNDNQTFIELIYENTLGKTFAEDPIGIEYWVGELDSGNSKGQIITSLINAAMDPQYTGLPAQNRFINKVAVSCYTADTIATCPDVNDLSAFVDFTSGVTDDSATVETAKAAVDAF